MSFCTASATSQDPKIKRLQNCWQFQLTVDSVHLIGNAFLQVNSHVTLSLVEAQIPGACPQTDPEVNCASSTCSKYMLAILSACSAALAADGACTSEGYPCCCCSPVCLLLLLSPLQHVVIFRLSIKKFDTNMQELLLAGSHLC